MSREIYTPPRRITNIKECAFYHTIDLPGFGLKEAVWDLRSTAKAYLGDYDPFTGKRVLEVGCANGFLSFHMESRGAEVVAYDLSENDLWDVVPYARGRQVKPKEIDLHPHITDWRQWQETRRLGMRRINNAFWYTHRLLDSKARMVNGSVYALPKEIGYVDVCTFGSILLHVRDPFQALYRALRLTKETAIITDVEPGAGTAEHAQKPAGGAYALFVPNASQGHPIDSWWQLTPELIVRMVAVLGFEDAEIRRFQQPHAGGMVSMYAVVANRTAAIEDLDEMED